MMEQRPNRRTRCLASTAGPAKSPGMPVEDEHESETSVDDDSQHRPPAKAVFINVASVLPTTT